MKKTLFIGSTLLLAAAAAFSQSPEAPPPPPHHGPGGPLPMHGPGPGGMDFRHTVTGAPFTAQIVSTQTQTLPDGSHIARSTNATIARDSQGRTYRQQAMEHLGPVSNGSGKTVIFIHDPVAHTSHVISPDDKTDMVGHMPERQRGPRGGDNAALEGGRQRPPRTRPNETVETLPAQMLEGVWAEGTRITHTIPAGTIGNDHELKVISETWYSKDLQEVVMSKHSDPRSGESTYRLTNIQRAEPDASLFQTPAGYKVIEHGRGR